MSRPAHCPWCGAHHKLVRVASPNGGWLFVGEDMDGSTETYDGDDVAEYTCQSCERLFYASEYKE